MNKDANKVYNDREKRNIKRTAKQAAKNYKNPKDDARLHKQVEVIRRTLAMPYTGNARCNSLGKIDIDWRKHGIVLEDKDGFGKIWYASKDRSMPAYYELSDFIDELFVGITHIVYNPFIVKGKPLQTALQGRVFTRQQFLEYLSGYTTKTGKPGKMVQIKHGSVYLISPNNSKPRLDYINGWLDRLPTYAEFVASVRTGTYTNR